MYALHSNLPFICSVVNFFYDDIVTQTIEAPCMKECQTTCNYFKQIKPIICDNNHAMTIFSDFSVRYCYKESGSGCCLVLQNSCQFTP